ncbi:MAG: DUF58 domain-containing protein [Halobacteriota archaeon]
MNAKQRTYVLLVLAVLFALVGAILDLWFYAVGGIATGIYVVARLFAFRSTIRQLNVRVERDARRETQGKDSRIKVCTTLRSNMNLTGFFTDIIPEDFVCVDGAHVLRLSLNADERVEVRYELVGLRDIDLRIRRAMFTFETDLFVHTFHMTTDPLEVKRPHPNLAGGISATSWRSGRTPPGEPSSDAHSSQLPGFGFELSHVRPYVHDDPGNRIAWKTSARLGTLMSNVFFAESEADAIEHGAPITVIVDQSGGMDGLDESHLARDVAQQIVEYVVRFAADNDSRVSLTSYDDENVSSLAVGETPSRVLQNVSSSLERSRLEPLRTPVRGRRGITNAEVVRFEQQYSQREVHGRSRLRDVIFYLYARNEAYLNELQQASAYRAVAESLPPAMQPSVLILISDLRDDMDPLIEGMRLASSHGSRVYLITLFSKLYEHVDDALIASEEFYSDYERYKAQLSKAARTDGVKVIEAPSVESLRLAFEQGALG